MARSTRLDSLQIRACTKYHTHGLPSMFSCLHSPLSLVWVFFLFSCRFVGFRGIADWRTDQSLSARQTRHKEKRNQNKHKQQHTAPYPSSYPHQVKKSTHHSRSSIATRLADLISALPSFPSDHCAHSLHPHSCLTGQTYVRHNHTHKRPSRVEARSSVSSAFFSSPRCVIYFDAPGVHRVEALTELGHTNTIERDSSLSGMLTTRPLSISIYVLLSTSTSLSRNAYSRTNITRHACGVL